MTNSPLPPQKQQTCPERACRAVNWLPIPPDAPCSAVVRFSCWSCGVTFIHICGSDSRLKLFLVRCGYGLGALPGLLAVLWFLAALYCLFWVVHVLGFLPLAALLVACGVCMSMRHEGIKEIPAALWLFAGAIALTRFSLLYLLHQPENVNAASALAVLIAGGSAWLGAPPADYVPLAWYDGDRHGNAPPAGLPQPDDIAKAGL